MIGYRMILECGCEEVWYDGDTFPGIGAVAECMGNDVENVVAGETHGTQKIVDAWTEEF
jgi:hypothetical protein